MFPNFSIWLPFLDNNKYQNTMGICLKSAVRTSQGECYYDQWANMTFLQPRKYINSKWDSAHQISARTLGKIRFLLINQLAFYMA